MYLFILAILAVFQLQAADEMQAALALQAQQSFDRVFSSPSPALPDIATCRQKLAAYAPVAPPEDTPLVSFRKGYCDLEAASQSGRPNDYAAAAGNFENAIKTWPMRAEHLKNHAVEPLPPALSVLASISRLKASPSDTRTMDQARKDLSLIVDGRSCISGPLPEMFCRQTLALGRQWLGWVAFEQDDLYNAAKYFIPGSPWSEWVEGRAAFLDRKYSQASAHYRQAVSQWEADSARQPSSLPERLRPAPRMSHALLELGGTQLVAGEANAAITTLNAAVKLEHSLSRALYLRGRAKEAAGQKEAALADYALASRTAFASAEELASGEAHLYRGVMLYRRGDFEKAEDEFSDALNFDIPDDMRPDAEAWRYMAAVAGGSCEASRERLERALETSSPYFPKAEARTLAVTCTGPTTSLRIPTSLQ